MLNGATSQHVLGPISTFILQKSFAHPSQRMFTSVTFVIKVLLVSISCDYINRRWTTHKVNRRPKMWTWHSWWERLTTRVLKNIWKRESTFLWNLRKTMGDIQSSIFPWTYWIYTLWTKSWTHISKIIFHCKLKKCAVNLKVAFRFVFKNVEDGTCR